VHRDAAVVIDGGDIVGLAARGDLPAALPCRDLPEGAWLAPGFIDVQVNGGGDVLFNDSPTVEGIRAVAAAHRRFGTTGLLPTLISDNLATMRAAAAAVDAAAAVMPEVLGIHFEGPFLSPERAGVHSKAILRAPSPEELALLMSPRRGVTLATVAPERLPPGTVGELVRSGVRVALGHSTASYDETRSALVAGLTGFTHLFNAMPPPLAREPGPVAAALEEPRAFYGLIVDGVHVAPAMLRLALRSLGQAMLVTDAMPPVGGRGRDFRLYGEEIRVEDGRCITADGTLAGSALDMASAVRNCVRLLDLPLTQALHLASAAPAAFLGLGHRLGHLMTGYRADIVALDPTEICVLASWVAGKD
jgi:N-acetylglucosamine-6-phosphate deacetylase